MSKIVIVPLKDCLSNNAERTQSIFNQLRDLQQKNVKVYIFGDYTKPAVSTIKKKYEFIPGTHFFSFNNLKTEKGLLDALLMHINVEENGLYTNNIVLFNMPLVAEPVSLLKQIYNRFVFLLKPFLGKNETIPAVVQGAQLPYKLAELPDLKQRSLLDVLEKDHKWEFKTPKSVEPKAKESKSTSSEKPKRRIKDPTYKPPKFDSSDDNYASETDRKPAITHQLKTVKSEKAKAKKRVRFNLTKNSTHSFVKESSAAQQDPHPPTRPSPADKTLTRR